MVMTIDILERATRVLKESDAVLAAYLHGSTAKGTNRPDSDVDIALLPARGQRIPLKLRLDLAAELEPIFGCVVDVGELTTNNVIYLKEVLEHGKELFSANRLATDLFMATGLAMYAELQQQRKEVIHAYTA